MIPVSPRTHSDFIDFLSPEPSSVHFYRFLIATDLASRTIEFGRPYRRLTEAILMNTVRIREDSRPHCEDSHTNFLRSLSRLYSWISPDNATNHSGHAPDALRVQKLNKGPGGAQPCMREGFIHHNGLPQTVKFPANCFNFTLARKPRGMKQILVLFVCNLAFPSRYMRPGGPWQPLRRCPKATGGTCVRFPPIPSPTSVTCSNHRLPCPALPHSSLIWVAQARRLTKRW